MKTPTKQQQRGFTLIELLLVIAIIGLLSSIVLAALQQGRIKARDAAKNSLVRQYVLAFEVARNDLGSYPFADDFSAACLGINNPDGECYYGTPENDYLNTLMASYIPGPPASTQQIEASGNNVSGIYFDCYTYDNTNTKCEVIYLEWVLESSGGTSRQCGIGASTGEIDGHTTCYYASSPI